MPLVRKKDEKSGEIFSVLQGKAFIQTAKFERKTQIDNWNA
ncbi:7758_t:CDS:2 [Cetraspora pellucida]|uniref:7758_t:CDS:1 n=1 Tax=Cetraspora pellucida TaxID=1433469 RepID=A0A9N9A1D7_9GLOM|nr:7758_t:CDS:2 [Cetraspora pellucida]